MVTWYCTTCRQWFLRSCYWLNAPLHFQYKPDAKRGVCSGSAAPTERPDVEAAYLIGGVPAVRALLIATDGLDSVVAFESDGLDSMVAFEL